MSCADCGGTRLMSISGKCDDKCTARIDHLGVDVSGDYLPKIHGVTEIDTIDLEFCLDCGTIQGYELINDEALKTLFNIEDEETDEDDES